MGFNYAHEAKKWKLWKDKEDDFLKKLNVDEKKIIIKKPLYIEEFYS